MRKKKEIKSTLYKLLETNDPAVIQLTLTDKTETGSRLMTMDELREINYSDLKYLADLLGLSSLYADGDKDGEQLD